MNQFDRIYALHKVLSGARYPVSNSQLQRRLECSPATIKRIIRDMRLYLHAPIEYDRELNGYYYAKDDDQARFELPGLWFNESEIVSLLVMDELLERTQPGLLDNDLAPVRKRLQTILKSQAVGEGELAHRVRVLRAAARPAGEYFQTVAGAVATRHRLRIGYHGRAKDSEATREVSPQRLTFYRDNWYLDAWCHKANGLRTFALDRIRAAQALVARAKNVSDKQLDSELAGAYGIFSGAPDNMAVLLFTPDAARWVADEQWHPDQRSRWLDDGRYELQIPYGQATELLQDVLAYGPSVEVTSPTSLRQAVQARLAAAHAQY